MEQKQHDQLVQETEELIVREPRTEDILKEEADIAIQSEDLF